LFGITPPLSQVGGKAKALIETTQAGFNVAEGFVLAVDFFRAWTRRHQVHRPLARIPKVPGRDACAALQEEAR
jgi:hypothetical protein